MEKMSAETPQKEVQREKESFEKTTEIQKAMWQLTKGVTYIIKSTYEEERKRKYIQNNNDW